ncbi:MAG: hypothetical protein P1V35_16740 [Planctomycetota bacterium]|nr:hypothetical protein [Planctomycetota bacterium]
MKLLPILAAFLAVSFASNSFGQSAWALKAPAMSPLADSSPSLAYDSGRQRMVQFGGLNNGGTFEYDGTDWVSISTAHSPSPRFAAALTYDAARQVVVLFGGTDASFNYLGDTWEYDGVDWTQINTMNSPEARDTHSLVYDSIWQRVLLIGGSGLSGRLTDTWRYDGTNWVLIAPTGSFGDTIQGAAVYDPIGHRVWYFGGLLPTFGMSDVLWVFRSVTGTWTQVLTTGPLPPGRRLHGAVWDASRQRMVVHGGAMGATFLSDTWEFDPFALAWSLSVGADGPAVQDFSMAYDSTRQTTVLWGGLKSAGETNETWEYSTGSTGVGLAFCNPASDNSMLRPAQLSGYFNTMGGISGGQSDLHLECAEGVPGQFGYFLVGTGRHEPGVAVSDGRFCLVGGMDQFFRYNVTGTSSMSGGVFDAAGVLQNVVGTSAIGSGYDVPDAVSGTTQTITAGSQWHFQVWYRDTPAGVGHSNFSNGLSVNF